MKKLVLTLMAAGLIFTGMNCSSSAGSCTIENSSSETGSAKSCINYTGADYDTDAVKSACSGLGGEFSEDGCDIEDSPGTCIVGEGTDAEFEYQYLSSVDNSKAKEACNTVGGTYEAN